MNPITMLLQAEPLIKQALLEDINQEDVSTNAIMPQYQKGQADLLCKEDGILAGIQIFAHTFFLLDKDIKCEFHFADGDEMKKGDLIGTIQGDIRAILSAERVALNYLQRMCGIATQTKKMVDLLKDTDIQLVDTRKTTPNNRIFEKYAVTVGGAGNHRYNLSDGVMLKDNHIMVAGGIQKAVVMARAYAPFVRKIEVETETFEQVVEAVEAKADIIMLDNMDFDTMKKCIDFIDKRAEIECSGNVTENRLKELKELKPDFISSGALTHSASVLDISLKNLYQI